MAEPLTARRFLAGMRSALPAREHRALELALGCCYPYQLAWILDFGGASVLVKSRRIGGSWAYALAASIWTLFGEDVHVISTGEREAKGFLNLVERHLRWLAALGSHWARPLHRRMRFDLTLRPASGGTCTALPASNAARSFGGEVILDEFSFMVDAAKVWDAAAAATLHGGKLRVLSTPNGPSGLFAELANATDDATTRHRVTLTEARAQGLRISDRKVRQIDRGIPALHARLFECSFAATEEALFRDVFYYDALPAVFQLCIGIDLAYTARTASDPNSAVVLARADDHYFVIEAVSEKTANFTPRLRQLHAQYPAANFWWCCSPTEAGLANSLRLESKLPVLSTTAHSKDKYTRALPVAEAWNEGRVLVPRSAPWLGEFIKEISSFTGARSTSDRKDDAVDALSSAFEALKIGAGTAGAPSLVPHSFGGGIEGAPGAPSPNGVNIFRRRTGGIG